MSYEGELPKAALTRLELAISSVTGKRGLLTPPQRRRSRERGSNPRDQDVNLAGGLYPIPQVEDGRLQLPRLSCKGSAFLAELIPQQVAAAGVASRADI